MSLLLRLPGIVGSFEQMEPLRHAVALTPLDRRSSGADADIFAPGLAGGSGLGAKELVGCVGCSS